MRTTRADGWRAGAILLLLGWGAAAALRPQSRAVSARSLGVRASIDTSAYRIRGAITAAVRTPLGAIPITGHVQAQYDCAAHIYGAVSYNPIVRLFARIKGVGLVSRLHASVSPVVGSGCAAFPDSLRGEVSINDTLVTGHIRVGSEVVVLEGPTWAVGDSAFAASLLAYRPGHSYAVEIRMFMRGGEAPPEVFAAGGVGRR
ncbi:MAG: hypothetical protein U0163_17925 [Gemmatimonadaceae bacterium]